MKLEFNLNTVLILAVFVLVWFFRDCGGEGKTGGGTDTVRTETVYRYDTVIHSVTTHKLFYQPDKEIEIIPESFDSNLAVKDYFTQRTFTDSLIDSNISASFSGMIWKNALFDPAFSYRLLRPQTIINNTIVKPDLRYKAFIGGFISYYGMKYPSIGGQFSLQNKRDQILTLGYGTGPTYYLGAQVKIKLKH